MPDNTLSAWADIILSKPKHTAFGRLAKGESFTFYGEEIRYMKTDNRKAVDDKGVEIEVSPSTPIDRV